MPVTIVGHLKHALLQNVAPGRMFIIDEGEGRLLCMKSPERIVVLGGRACHDNSPGFFNHHDYLGTNVVLLPDDLEIDLLPSGNEVDFGLAVPDVQRPNGSITIDDDEVGWICVRGGPGRAVFFNLQDGSIGSPSSARASYANWRLVWRKPGVREPVEIYRTITAE